MKNHIVVFIAESVSLAEPRSYPASSQPLQQNSDHSILMPIPQCKNSAKTGTQNITTVNSEPCWRPLMCLLTSVKLSRHRHYSSGSTSSHVLPAIKPNWLYVVKQYKNHSSLANSFASFSPQHILILVTRPSLCSCHLLPFGCLQSIHHLSPNFSIAIAHMD